MDNTLIFYDSRRQRRQRRRHHERLFNEMTYFNGVHETVAGHPEALR